VQFFWGKTRGSCLVLEQLLELGLDLPCVRPAPPMPGQVVGVRHSLQQGQLRLKRRTCLHDQPSACRQDDAQGGRPPASPRLWKALHLRKYSYQMVVKSDTKESPLQHAPPPTVYHNKLRFQSHGILKSQPDLRCWHLRNCHIPPQPPRKICKAADVRMGSSKGHVIVGERCGSG